MFNMFSQKRKEVASKAVCSCHGFDNSTRRDEAELQYGCSQFEREAARRVVENSKDDMVSYAEFRQILADTATDGRVESIDEEKVFALVLDMGLRVGEAVADQKNQYVSFVAWCGSRDELIERIRLFIQSQKSHNASWINLWLCRPENVDSYEDGRAPRRG